MLVKKTHKKHPKNPTHQNVYFMLGNKTTNMQKPIKTYISCLVKQKQKRNTDIKTYISCLVKNNKHAQKLKKKKKKEKRYISCLVKKINKKKIKLYISCLLKQQQTCKKPTSKRTFHAWLKKKRNFFLYKTGNKTQY